MHPELNVVVICNEGLTMSERGIVEIAVNNLPRNSPWPIPPLLHVRLKPNATLVAFDNPLPNTESAVANNDLPGAVDRLRHLQHCCHRLSQPRRELRRERP
jgi:hypothetical protein